MGKIGVHLIIDGVPENQLATVKNALDAQIATWTTTYPSLTFSRGGIQWSE